jgi:hypothetical protein
MIFPQSERESYMTKLFNANGPTATITAISMDKCSEVHYFYYEEDKTPL